MSDYGSFNEAEYNWGKKASGKNLFLRILLIIGYVLAGGLYFVLVAVVTKALPLFAVCPILLWILIFFTWRLVSYDCYVYIRGGHFECGRILRRKSGKKKLPIVSSELPSCVAFPFSGTLPMEVAKQTDLSSSPASANRIVLIYQEKGTSRAVIFDGSAEIARLLRLHCKDAKELNGVSFH